MGEQKVRDIAILAGKLEDDLGLREEQAVMIMYLMDTEEKQRALIRWVVQRVENEVPMFTEDELFHAVTVISKTM